MKKVKSLQKKTDTCVHTEHCCLTHGCKYGDDDCPVALEQKKQSYPCEYCTDEMINGKPLDSERANYHKTELHPDEAYILHENLLEPITAEEARIRCSATHKWMKQVALTNLLDDCYRHIGRMVDMKALISFDIPVYWKYDSVAHLAVAKLKELGYYACVKDDEKEGKCIEVNIHEAYANVEKRKRKK